MPGAPFIALTGERLLLRAWRLANYQIHKKNGNSGDHHFPATLREDASTIRFTCSGDWLAQTYARYWLAACSAQGMIKAYLPCPQYSRSIQLMPVIHQQTMLHNTR